MACSATKHITITIVKLSMGKVARECAGLLASTLRFKRLAAYLPGLVCPYRQVGSFFVGWLSRRAHFRRSSPHSVHANFYEKALFVKADVAASSSGPCAVAGALRAMLLFALSVSSRFLW